jgi:hypothetical protein
LVELHGKTGDWAKATADYHSANPAEGEPYAAKVASVWPEEQRKAGSPPVPFAPGRMAPVRGGQFANGFARRQPPRMMPLTVETPGRLAMASATDGAPTSGGSLAPLGMRWAGEPHQAAAFGQAAMNPGRGLDFYRTVPIRQTLPLRLIAKLPNRPTR